MLHELSPEGRLVQHQVRQGAAPHQSHDSPAVEDVGLLYSLYFISSMRWKEPLACLLKLGKELPLFFETMNQMMRVTNTPAKNRPTAIPATPPSCIPSVCAYNEQMVPTRQGKYFQSKCVMSMHDAQQTRHIKLR